MSAPTVKATVVAVAFLSRAARSPRLYVSTPVLLSGGGGGGASPAPDSPLKVWDGTAWVVGSAPSTS